LSGSRADRCEPDLLKFRELEYVLILSKKAGFYSQIRKWAENDAPCSTFPFSVIGSSFGRVKEGKCFPFQWIICPSNLKYPFLMNRHI